MSMTDQGTQTLQTVATQLLNTGVRLTLKVTHLSVSTMINALKEARLAHKETGQVKLKNLVPIRGGDVHAQKIDPDLHKMLVKELKARGVTFSIENAPDGNLYVHFAGQDLPTLEHAITQAEARLEKTQERDTPNKTEPTKDTGELSKETPETTPTKSINDASREAPTRTFDAPTQKLPQPKKDLMSRIKSRAQKIRTNADKAPKPVRLPSKGAR